MNSFNPCTSPTAQAPAPRGNQICEHRFHSRGSSESRLGEKPKERAGSLPSSARERPSQREGSSVSSVGELSEEPPSPTTVPGLLRSLLSTHQACHKQGDFWKKDTRTLDIKKAPGGNQCLANALQAPPVPFLCGSSQCNRCGDVLTFLDLQCRSHCPHHPGRRWIGCFPVQRTGKQRQEFHPGHRTARETCKSDAQALPLPPAPSGMLASRPSPSLGNMTT